jgi:hypothetical protein
MGKRRRERRGPLATSGARLGRRNPEFVTAEYRGTQGIGTTIYRGFIKCKMAHRQSGSFIIPDQIYLTGEPLLWFEPLSFTANLIARTDDFIECRLYVDIAGGHLIALRFRASEHRRPLEDHSQFFECEITGPTDLANRASGVAIISPEGRIALKLFHHTKDETAPLIVASRHLRLSAWNIQGNRQLANVGYAYFTSLPTIRSEADLK